MNRSPVLVAGATGYVGGRLVPRLLEMGFPVRALGRSMRKMAARPWAGRPGVEMVRGDVMDIESLRNALSGCRAAYYLVHSMEPSTRDFARADRIGAANMVRAAAEAGLERLIYLSGLVPDDPDISTHLKSRAEVADILASGPVPTTVLRAAMIIGSGSASFEIMRFLVDRLPVMITPAWVRTEVQPICIRNVLGYLAGCLVHDETRGRVFDICGPDVLTYEALFRIYAEEAGLPRRVIIPVPLLTPRLSAYWIHLVTPVHAAIARPLTHGLKNRVVCTENSIREIIHEDLLDARYAVRRALEKKRLQIVETCWTDAGRLRPPEWVQKGDAPYAGGAVLANACRIVLAGEAENIWAQIERIGGETGWYFADVLWRVRGRLDKLAGGISLGRGRRHPTHLAAGDAVDFWRVLEIHPPNRLMLVADMKAPGEAVLTFDLIDAGPGRVELRAVGRFLPRGLWGLAYWYALLPAHQAIYKGMLRRMARAAGTPILRGPELFNPATEPDVCRID